MKFEAKIVDYRFIDSVLVIDFSTYDRTIGWSRKADQRLYVLPEDVSNFKLPGRTWLLFQRIFMFRKKYIITITCPERVLWPDDIIARVYLEKYNIFVVNEDYMYWHVCELKGLQLSK
jgi:hypothetical protein